MFTNLKIFQFLKILLFLEVLEYTKYLTKFRYLGVVLDKNFVFFVIFRKRNSFSKNKKFDECRMILKIRRGDMKVSFSKVFQTYLTLC